MNSLKHQLERWLDGLIVFKDVVGFLGPVDLSARSVPAKAAGVTYALSLSQESFTVFQIRI
jgi:hypothetical protein